MKSAKEPINKHTFEEFKKSCETVLKMSDQEILRNFGSSEDPKSVRLKYQYMLANTTCEDFKKYQSADSSNYYKVRGNVLFEQGKYAEAIAEYKEGLMRLDEITSQDVKAVGETILRSNLAVAYTKNGQSLEAIAECKKVLEKEPYNVKAIYAIALAYKEQKDYEKAAEYLKRVIVRKSTDSKLAKLYKELVKPEPKNLPDIILNHIKTNKQEEIRNELRKEGYLLTDSDIREFFSLKNLNIESVKSKIQLHDRKRRYIFFSKYPVIEDLLEDPLLLSEVEMMAEDENSNFTKHMMKVYPGLQHSQLKEAIKGIKTRAMYMKYIDYFPSKGSIVFGSILVLVIAYYLYKHFTHNDSL